VKHCVRLCLLAAILAGAAAPAAAQGRMPRRSHVPIEGGIAPGLADEFLKDRLQQAQAAAELERVLADLVEHPGQLGIGPREQEALRNALREAGGQPAKALADPEVRRILAEVAQKRGERFDISEADRRRLEELARRFIDPAELQLTPDKTGDAADPGPAKESRPAGDTLPIGPPPSADPPAGPVAAPEPPNPAVAERLRDIADALADSPLGESPAFRRMVASIERVKKPESPDFVTWDRRLTQLEDRFGSLRTRLPSVSWPKAEPTPSTPAGLVSAALPMPDSGPEGGQEIVLVCLASVTAGFVAWGMLRRRGLLGWSAADRGRALGPWPVRPEAVGTRHDLVRAFEYLAVLRLGPAARSQNHREIAERLGAADVRQRGAAERLAALYEQARYAPPEEELPTEDLAAARAALTHLAGAAAP
jgi:hypothetical protein